MKIANTFDEQDLDEIPKLEGVEEDDKSTEVEEEYKRTLASDDDANAKQSFSKLSLKLAKLHVSYMSTPFDQLNIFLSGN